MIRAHRDSVKSFLTEQGLTGAVFGSFQAAQKVAGLQRYAVVFVALSSKQRPRYTGQQTRETYTVTVHSIGSDEDASLWVAERVDRLTGKTLTVTGRSLRPVEFITAQPPDLDDDGPDPLWFTITQFDITSDPAP